MKKERLMELAGVQLNEAAGNIKIDVSPKIVSLIARHINDIFDMAESKTKFKDLDGVAQQKLIQHFVLGSVKLFAEDVNIVEEVGDNMLVPYLNLKKK